MSAGSSLAAAAYLGAALLAAEPVGAPEAGREVTQILAQERYYFCTEANEYLPLAADQRWCELAAASDFSRCSGYEAVCKRSVAGGELDWELWDQAGEDGGEGDEPDKKSGRANQGAYEERDFELPDLGIFAKLLMWTLIIGGSLAIIYVIAKNFVRGREDEGELELEAEPEAGDSLLAARAAAMRVVETDVQRLLARAEQAAAKGDHEAAINDTYAALLRRLEGEQLIAVDHWKTNGDYLEDLRPRPPLRDEVREIVREVEQVQFGAAAAEPERYRSVRAKVLSIVGRATLAFMLVLGGATQIGCRLFEKAFDEDARPDSSALAGLGTGPMDQRAVGELLLAFDIEARHRTRTIEQLAQTKGAIILLESVELLEQDWDTLIAWVEEEGGTLVIATGEKFPRELGVDYTSLDQPLTALEPGDDLYFFSGLELVAPPGEVLSLGAGAAGRSEELLVRALEPDYASEDAETYTFEPGGTRPYVVRRPLGGEGGEVLVFAEPDLLTNAGISVADNAAFLVNLLRSREIEEVEFIDHYTGAGADDPFESVANAKLGALFLQILLFLALLYAAVGIPFARLRDPEQQRRRSFAEHVKTLGQRYAQAKAARHVAGLYTGWALDRLRERLQPGAARGLLSLAQAIAARTGRGETEVMQILVAAHSLREGAASTRGGASDLELMRQLAKLLDEAGGAR